MKRLVMDIDGTIAELKPSPASSYRQLQVRPGVVERLAEYRAMGFQIILHSSRGMASRGNSIGRINAEVLPDLLAWLEEKGIPFDEIHIGKPWCGTDGFYVDDRAIRPSEFATQDHAAIQEILDYEAKLAKRSD